MANSTGSVHTPSLLTGLIVGVLGVAACGQASYQAPAPPPMTPPAVPEPPPAPPGTSPVYPSLGSRLGDPNRIGPDDLRLAVDSAQSVTQGSRLMAIEPGTAAGRPVWNVRLLTEGPSMKQVEVDAVVRAGKGNDVQVPPMDLTKVLDIANSSKVPWQDAVGTVQKQNPGTTVSTVALDTNAPIPAWKIGLLTANQQIMVSVDANTGAPAGKTFGPRAQSDYH
jgi:hypothetical protein